MTKSIIQDTKETCFFCGARTTIRHHVFGGSGKRLLAEKDGCWLYLCAEHHTGSNYSVHLCRERDLYLKRIAQKKWESIYGSRQDFIKRYGKSWL